MKFKDKIWNKIKDNKIVKNKITIFLYTHILYTPPRKFKKALIKMFEVYPYGMCPKEDIEKLIPAKDILDLFHGGFIRYNENEKTKEVDGYKIGISSLSLISMWRIERLTKVLIVLTIVLLIPSLKIIWNLIIPSLKIIWSILIKLVG